MTAFVPHRLGSLAQAAAPSDGPREPSRAGFAVQVNAMERVTALAVFGVGAATAATLVRGVSVDIPAWQSVALGLGWLVAGSASAALYVRLRLRSGRMLAQANEALRRFVHDPHETNCDVLRQWRPDAPAWREHFESLADALESSQRHLLEVERRATGQNIRVHQLEGELEDLNDFLRRLETPVAAIDAFGEIRLANDAFRELLLAGVEAGETPRLESISCPALAHFAAEIQQHHRIRYRTRELSAPDADGSEHWYRVTCRRLREKTPGGDSILLVSLASVQEQKSIQRRHAEFVSNVAHEMKTPLAGIKAYVELLGDDDVEKSTRDEFLETIDGQTDRLKRLIDNLLNMARIEAGVVRVAKEPISLNACLEEAARIVQPTAQAKGVEFKVELTSLFVHLHADRDLLMQAALNLLSNAVKYTPPGGTATLRSVAGEGEASFEVIDTGVGLDESDLKRVFDKFYRVQKDEHMAPGTGLGLALVKLIVEDVHGGRVAVESAPGRGSTFRATFRTA